MKAITALRKGRSWTLGGSGIPFNSGNWVDNVDLIGGPVLTDREPIGDDFDSAVEDVFRRNGIVFTVLLIRQHVLSEARFRYQRLVNGRPGDLYGTPGDLDLLEEPWPNGTTGELIARMEQDASLAGNFFATIVDDAGPRRLRRLRPDWVTIVTVSPRRDDGSPGKPWDVGARVGGYLYHPGPELSDVGAGTLLTPDEVVHYAPLPDPAAQWRGMSWLPPVASEIGADRAATRHKLKFFDNGGSSNTVITYDKDVSPARVRAAAQLYQEQHAGLDNAYRTVHLGGGADVKTAGANLEQMDFKVTQGAGESRIAAASLVGAVMAQFSEGMAGSSLNAGNFAAAKRRFADVGARPLWRSMSAALGSIVDVPAGSRLWYDDRDIPFLADDAKDAAEILNLNAAAIRTLSDGGFVPSSVVESVTAGDLRQLEHSGLLPVQVQPAGETAGDDTTPAATPPDSDATRSDP